MKKRFLIILVALLWCNVGVAEVIKYDCSYPDLSYLYFNLDTDRKTLSAKYYDTRSNKAYEYNYTTITMNEEKIVVRDKDDTFAWEFYYKKNKSPNSGNKYRGKNLYPQKNSDYYICKTNLDSVAKKPKKKKPKSNPDDNKVVAASSGSGFFVTRTGHLVTNYHVVEECDAVKVSFNAKEIQADTIAIDKYNDLAIIKANINPSKVFPVSKEDVSLLQEVIVAGFPLGKKISALIKTHKGNVSALAGIGDNYSNFQTDATINHGNSGGPILTQKGNVIGVAVQLIPPDKAQNVFFGVKSSTLNTFAKANNVNFLPPNTQEMSNEDLGQLITEATVFLECWMTVAKIKQLIAQEENRKAFYSKFK